MFLLFRSQAFRAVGGFDSRYFLYIEDVDICTRLRVAGWRLLQVSEAEVIHDARKQSHRSLKYTRWHLAGMLRYWSSPGFWRYRRLLSRSRRHQPTM
jgi:GT2 family glycosyltransferase